MRRVVLALVFVSVLCGGCWAFDEHQLGNIQDVLAKERFVGNRLRKIFSDAIIDNVEGAKAYMETVKGDRNAENRCGELISLLEGNWSAVNTSGDINELGVMLSKPVTNIQSYDEVCYAVENMENQILFRTETVKQEIEDKENLLKKYDGTKETPDINRAELSVYMEYVRQSTSWIKQRLAVVRKARTDMEGIGKRIVLSKLELEEITGRIRQTMAHTQTKYDAMYVDTENDGTSINSAAYNINNLSIGYMESNIELWDIRYRVMHGLEKDKIWEYRKKAHAMIAMTAQDLEYINRMAYSLLHNTSDDISDNEKKTLIKDIVEISTHVIPGHLFLARRTVAEIDSGIKLVNVKDRVSLTGRDMFYSIINTVLWSSDDYSITVKKFLMALGLFIVGFMCNSGLSKFIQKTMFPIISRDSAAAHFTQRIIFYALQLAFLLMALHTADIPLTSFAFLGGALAIGIGFGTQNIFNNIISGLILMTARPFRVGDIVEMSGTQAKVLQISDRSTLLRMNNGVNKIVPNSFFLEHEITNWTHSGDAVNRYQISVDVPHSQNNPKLICDCILEIAKSNASIKKSPSPFVVLSNLGSHTAQYTLFCWIDLLQSSSDIVTGQIRVKIVEEFGRIGINLTVPWLEIKS